MAVEGETPALEADAAAEPEAPAAESTGGEKSKPKSKKAKKID